MSLTRVAAYLDGLGLSDRIHTFEVSSATVALAAQAVGVIPARIAKTLSFRGEDSCIVVVTAGDAKIDNAKYKVCFGVKAKMLTPEEALTYTGYAVGGVCPFALDDQVPVYLDVSLRRFDRVFPAAGTASSAVALTPGELEAVSRARAWVDVCKGWEAEA